MVHSVANGLDLLSLVVLDLDVKLLLKLHDQLHGVERVSTQVQGEIGLILYLRGIDIKLVNADVLYLLCDFVTCHIGMSI